MPRFAAASIGRSPPRYPRPRLELAAVRLGSLSLDQLNQGLAGELAVLDGGNRGAEARQQTLEAAIGWSYGLLSEQERLLWARLSVFAGGCEEDAVTQVCADTRPPAAQIAGLLGALVEKSILKRQLVGSGARYWLLDTLRQYGRQRLREIGERAAMQKRHFEWICALAKLAGAWDARQAEIFHRMSGEQDNLWVALDFCLEQPSEVEARAELAQNLHVSGCVVDRTAISGESLVRSRSLLRNTPFLVRSCSGGQPPWPSARTTTTPAPR